MYRPQYSPQVRTCSRNCWKCGVLRMMAGGLRPDGLPSKYCANVRMNTRRGACCAMLITLSTVPFSSSSTAMASGVKLMPSGRKLMVVRNMPLLCLSADNLGAVSSDSSSSVLVMARLQAWSDSSVCYNCEGHSEDASKPCPK